MTDEELQAILDRDCKGLLESGLPYSADDIVDDLVKEVLKLRRMTKIIANSGGLSSCDNDCPACEYDLPH